MLWRPALRDAVAHLLLAAGATSPGRRAAGRLAIVTFHRVLPEPHRREYPYPGLVVTPAELERFLGFLASHFTCETLRDAAGLWAAGERTEKPLAAITFDDGQLDNFLHARPELERAGVPGTFFVPARHVESTELLWHDRLGYAVGRVAEQGEARLDALAEALGLPRPLPCEPGELAAVVVEAAKRMEPQARERSIARAAELAGGESHPDWDGMMGWEQLALLDAAGHEIGSHGLTHALLPGLEAGLLEREVAGSRERLEAGLGRPVDSFCYPNGDWDEPARDAVRAAGYARAVTTRWGTSARGADAFTLRRCDLQAPHAEDRRGVFSEARLAWRLSGLHPGLH